MSPRLQSRLVAALMLLPLLVLATATGSFGLRCTMTGEVLPECCCGESAGPPTEEVPSTLSEAECCDRLVREVVPQAAEVAPSQRVLPDPSALMPTLAVATSSIIAAPEGARSRPVARASVGPPTGRLRLLAKSSFLI